MNGFSLNDLLGWSALVGVTLSSGVGGKLGYDYARHHDGHQQVSANLPRQHHDALVGSAWANRIRVVLPTVPTNPTAIEAHRPPDVSNRLTGAEVLWTAIGSAIGGLLGISSIATALADHDIVQRKNQSRF